MVATDVGCAGSCPILTLVRVIPTSVEGCCRGGIFLCAIPCLRRSRKDSQGRAQTYCDDQKFSHITSRKLPKLRVLLLTIAMRHQQDLIRDNCVWVQQFRLSSSYAACRQAFHPAGRQGRPHAAFVPPQLSQPVEKPPTGPQWLHEIKIDGYRVAARIDNGRVQLLDSHRPRLDAQISSAVAALATVKVKTAYIDGKLERSNSLWRARWRWRVARLDGGFKGATRAYRFCFA